MGFQHRNYKLLHDAAGCSSQKSCLDFQSCHVTLISAKCSIFAFIHRLRFLQEDSHYANVEYQIISDRWQCRSWTLRTWNQYRRRWTEKFIYAGYPNVDLLTGVRRIKIQSWPHESTRNCRESALHDDDRPERSAECPLRYAKCI